MQSAVLYPSLGQALPSLLSLSLSLAVTISISLPLCCRSVSLGACWAKKEFGFVSGWDFSLWKFLIYSHVNFPLWHLRDLIVLARYYFVTLKNNYRVCLCLFPFLSPIHLPLLCFGFCFCVFLPACWFVNNFVKISSFIFKHFQMPWKSMIMVNAFSGHIFMILIKFLIFFLIASLTLFCLSKLKLFC